MSTPTFGLAHRRLVEGDRMDKEKRVRRAECGPSFRLGWMAAQGGKGAFAALSIKVRLADKAECRRIIMGNGCYYSNAA
jgi:hypothetical protein